MDESVDSDSLALSSVSAGSGSDRSRVSEGFLEELLNTSDAITLLSDDGEDRTSSPVDGSCDVGVVSEVLAATPKESGEGADASDLTA